MSVSFFIICLFRFLQRLLFVHGRLNFLRTSKVILWVFFKSILLSFPGECIFFTPLFSVSFTKCLLFFLLSHLPVLGFGCLCFIVSFRDVSNCLLFVLQMPSKDLYTGYIIKKSNNKPQRQQIYIYM